MHTINPMWFYVANLVPGLGFITLFLGLFLTITGFLIVIDKNKEGTCDSVVGTKSIILGTFFLLLFFLIPSKLAVLQMAVASSLGDVEVNEATLYYIVNTAKNMLSGM